ncbi:Na+/H+ antiporter subunit A [Arthrobacter livingstonensis]|uniref:Na+/H+ antiporter subunit A n=1 Tax=Arthrobacter livingstonensis TaxID=670078 RepID=A0A2V5L5T7_9MICC|nr:Na+/H+ antiporter subunit A [Arthrobacter livingstonensis]PYI65544.1 Na+/H+ antiporter subunit A [Arthrobacter livingstonensis]
MLIVLCAHFIVAMLAPILFSRWGRAAFYVLAAVPAASFVWLLAQYGNVYSDSAPSPTLDIPWVPALDLNLTFRMDQLSWLMSLLVLGVGALVLAYCTRYFKSADAGLGGFGAQLLAFAGTMFGLVTADNLILLFVFWELTTVLSYLLIGYARTRIAARRAALQALIVTTFGGLAMLVGLIMVGEGAGTYSISGVLAKAPELVAAQGTPGRVLDIGIALILVGAVTKSALLPFHFWLPGAMAAPTPVSAYLHAAAMVKAGIYLVARLAPGFSGTEYWQVLITVLGLATMLLGGWRALRQHDLKLILAYGTVSQLGFIMTVVGLGSREAALAGMAMVLAHGLFKATLFLVVGIIDHQSGTRDIRELSGVFRSAPKLGVVALIGAASMAGLPPLAGFVAKESVFAAFEANARYGSAGHMIGVAVLAVMVLGSILTFAYSARFMWGGFASKPSGMGLAAATPFKPVGWLFLGAPALLSALTLAYGLYPPVVEAWIAPYSALFPADDPHGLHLALWHGFTLPLALSGVVVAGGLGLFLVRGRFEALQGKLRTGIDFERGYRQLIVVLDQVAIWVTGRTQRGSLFFYLAVILATAIASVGAVLVWTEPSWTAQKYFVDPGSPFQVIAGIAMLVGAFGAAGAKRRFMAVLMVSVTGYGMALIFALQGAPDLALTQMLVETIILVAFVLALRSLPPGLAERGAGEHKVLRAILGTAFGALMVVVGIVAMGSRIATPVSLSLPKMAYEGGGGLNVVNVTLVDIRVWDTFGEISVLAIAATGVASLIFVRGRGQRLARAETVAPGSIGRVGEPGRVPSPVVELAKRFAVVPANPWLVAGRTLAPERRSVIFEVVTRLVFHSIIVLSIYLLLAGHNGTGGGFAGGLVAGLALTIRYLAGGRFELAEATRVSAGTLLGVGLAAAALTGIAPLFFGGEVFQSAILTFDLPVFGHVKFVTSTLFDIGVYLVVVGLVIDVLRSLGSEIDQHEENGIGAITMIEDDEPLEVAR